MSEDFSLAEKDEKKTEAKNEMSVKEVVFNHIFIRN